MEKQSQTTCTVKYFDINNLSNTLTDILTRVEEKPADKLDMLLNPKKVRQQKEGREMAKKDLRDGGQKIVTSEYWKLTKLRFIHHFLIYFCNC